MAGFPTDTPTLSDVNAGFEDLRFELELKYVREKIQDRTLEIYENGGDGGVTRYSHTLYQFVPEEMDDSECQALKEDASSMVTACLEGFETKYAPYFDDDQQSQLEHMLNKYGSAYEELGEMAESNHIDKVDELTEDWVEAASGPFNDEFRAPLPGAIARHRDMAGYLQTALGMEAAAQVRIRKAYAELPEAAFMIMGSGGQLPGGNGLAYFSIGAAVASMVIPPAATVFGLLSLGAAVLDVAKVERDIEFDFSMESQADGRFLDLISEINKGLSAVADALDEARESAASDLREAMQAAELDLDRWDSLPRHLVPGGELLD